MVGPGRLDLPRTSIRRLVPLKPDVARGIDPVDAQLRQDIRRGLADVRGDEKQRVIGGAGQRGRGLGADSASEGDFVHAVAAGCGVDSRDHIRLLAEMPLRGVIEHLDREPVLCQSRQRGVVDLRHVQ